MCKNRLIRDGFESLHHECFKKILVLWLKNSALASKDTELNSRKIGQILRNMMSFCSVLIYYIRKNKGTVQIEIIIKTI